MPWQLWRFPSPPHCQVEVPVAPFLIAAHGHLRRFYQQETQQRVPLFRDVSQAPSLPARIFQRHQPQITGDLLATLKPICSADDQHEGQCRQRTNSGMRLQALRLGTLLRLLLDGWVNSAIVGVSRSSNSSRSCRRRLAHGDKRNDSSCSRPASRHSPFLQRSPSLSATACNWFMIRVRACTIRCRCHSSCRRSRFSQLGTQIRGKRFSISSCRISCASCRSVFCFRTRFARISLASPIHNSNGSSPSSRSNQRACPLASIPTRTLVPWAARSR